MLCREIVAAQHLGAFMNLKSLLIAVIASVGLVGAANATTWDPAKADADISLSANNTKATHSGSTARDDIAEATVFRSTGKYTFTITLGPETSLHNSIGFVNASAPHGIGNYPGQDANGFGVLDNGEVYQMGALGFLGISYTNNSVVDVAVDLGGHLLWMRVGGGNWNGSSTANPATGAGGFSFPTTMGAIAPAVDIYTLNDSAAVNFASGPFGLSGFQAWDTATALNGCMVDDSSGNPTNTWSCSMPAAAAAGDTLVISEVGYYNGGAAVSNVVNSIKVGETGDVFQIVDQDYTNAPVYAQQTWYLPNATAGGKTIVVTLNACV